MASPNSLLEGQMSRETLEVYRAIPRGQMNHGVLMKWGKGMTGRKGASVAQSLKRLVKIGAIKVVSEATEGVPRIYEVP